MRKSMTVVKWAMNTSLSGIGAGLKARRLPM
jgi:hypothetical protein